MVCGIGFPRLVGFGMPFQLKPYELTSWRVENPKMVSQNCQMRNPSIEHVLRWWRCNAPVKLEWCASWVVGNDASFWLGGGVFLDIFGGIGPGSHLVFLFWKLFEVVYSHLVAICGSYQRRAPWHQWPSRPGVELQEVGIKSPMDHQDQCWTLDQAHDPNRGMGPGLLNRVEKWSMNSESETWIVDEPFANFSF